MMFFRGTRRSSFIAKPEKTFSCLSWTSRLGAIGEFFLINVLNVVEWFSGGEQWSTKRGPLVV